MFKKIEENMSLMRTDGRHRKFPSGNSRNEKYSI